MTHRPTGPQAPRHATRGVDNQAAIIMVADLLQLARSTKYPVEAFAFVQRGLDFTVKRTHGKRDPHAPIESRHITGRQLCHGLRDYAIQQYGLMARAVLKRWQIRGSEDFGRIVFAMVDAGLLSKTDEDDIADFVDVFNFAEAFNPQLELAENN
jgi:uncharacterized repeat protein (TIGR04138 family)